MSILILLLAGLLALFGVRSTSDEPTDCVVSSDGTESCAPVPSDGVFVLPESGDVLTLTVNNGPLPPEFQAGYSVVIQADGTTTVTVSPQGSSAEMGSDQTAAEIVTVEDIGTDGVLAVLDDMTACGYFTLPPAASFEGKEQSVGGGVEFINIDLANGSWSVYAEPLSGAEQATFAACRTLIEDRFSITPPDM